MSFKSSILARVLNRVATAVCKYPKWFVYPQIILSALCVFYTMQRLKVDMDRDNLVGAGARYRQIYSNYRQEFRGEDQELVVVESEQWERNRRFIERLAARLTPRTNLFTDLFYKGDVANLGPKGLLLAPAVQLEQMRDSAAAYAPVLRTFTQATNLDSLFSLVNGQFRAGRKTTGRPQALLNEVPLLQGIVEEANQSMSQSTPPATPDIEGFFGGESASGSQAYLTFEDGRLFLLTVRPQSKDVATQAIEYLRQAIEQTQMEVTGVNVGLTGNPVLNYDEMHQSEQDSKLASVVALVVCSLIFIVAYREVTRPLKAALCLLIGVGYSLGFATLAVGHLNILSVTFAPMLIGLAIDFGVHFISRYEEEMRKGHQVAQAIHRASVYTGQGIVVGGLTMAAAFLAMGLTRFRGIQEVGIICGGGLLLCLVPMMTALPALLILSRETERDYQVGVTGHARLQIERVWLQHPALVVTATVVLCIDALMQLGWVYFDYDLLRMQSPNLASVRSEYKLIHAAGRSTMFAAVIADSLQQAREYEARIKTLPTISGVDSVARFLTEEQERKLEAVRALKNELAGVKFAPKDAHPVQIEELSATLWYLNGYLGVASEAVQKENPTLSTQFRSLRERIGAFRKTLLCGEPQVPDQLYQYQSSLFQQLNNTIEALQNQDASGPLRPQDLPAVMRDRFIGVTGKYLLQVYSKKDAWQHENQHELIQQLQTVVPPEKVTGQPVQAYESTALLKHSYEQAAWYALGAIIVMLLLHFRSPGLVILALLPVGIGSLWLLGFMGSFNIPFNPANIMILPLVVGIGVTNGIHILNRFAEEQRPDIFGRSTGKAVLVSGLTAITGFATLVLANHQGIKSLGEVMSAGLAACMVAALTILPAILSLVIGHPWAMRFLQEQIHFGFGWHRLRPRRP
jgi:hopanoid biosynthesis associated RND transporter like protein HpnN